MARKHTRTRLLAGALISVVTAASLTLLASPPAQAAPPAPSNLQASSDPIPVLSWDRVDTATSYKLQLSDNAAYNAGTFTKTITTTNVRYVPTFVPKEGELYWRVQALEGSVAGDWGEPVTATIIGTHLAPTGVTITPANATAAIMPPVEPPVIRWNGVPGAIGYDVEMDGEGDGVGGIVKTNIRTTSYVWPDPQGVGETGGVADFFVRVRAKFDNGLQTDWSDQDSSDSFFGTRYEVGQLPDVTYAGTCPSGVLCAPESPPDVRPSIFVEDVVFDWDPVRGAKEYEIWISQDESFSSTPIDRRIVSGTRYSPKTTYGNADYFWQVRAINAAGQPQPWPGPLRGSPFTRHWPDAPVPVYPPSSASEPIGGDLYFQWTPVQHATRYEMVIGTNPGLSTGTQTCLTAQTTFTVGQSGDACSPGTLRLSEGTAYYWKVRAIDEPRGVNGIYSPVSAVVYESDPITRLSPAQGSTTGDPSLRWSANSATAPYQKYHVYLYDNTSTLVDHKITRAQSWTPEVPLDPAKNPYYWGVRGLGALDNATVLRTGSFSYAPPTPGATPLKANPSVYGDSNRRFPSLSWQPIANADYYRLTVFNSVGNALDPGTTDVLDTNLPHPSVTDWDDFFVDAPGTYTYAVSAWDTTDDGDVWLGSTSFANRGTFTLESLPAVTGLELALDGAALDAGTTCDTAIDYGNVPATTCPAVPATPVLNWDPVPGAGAYKVYLFEDANFTTAVYDPDETVIENTRWTPDLSLDPEQLGDSTGTGAYYWAVVACVKHDCGIDLESTTQAATNSFKKQSPPVVLTSPAHNSLAADEITFSWEDYRTTNTDFPSYPTGGSKSPQSGTTYRVQVSQSPTITDGNAIDDQIVDQTTYTVYEDLYPEGDLYWRVQAYDAANNRLTFSETRKITKATPAANLNPDVLVANERPYVDTTDQSACRLAHAADTVPCNTFPSWQKQVDTGELAFSWPAESFDSTYALEVYKNNDTTGSSSNRVISLTGLKQSAALGNLALAPSSTFEDAGAYRWRIKRTDAYGNQGPWSDYGKFWVKPAAVTLTSPATGTPQPPNGPLLTWEPYGTAGSQAHHYAVDIRNAVTNASVGSINETSATAFAPTVSYATGTYKWVVTAYDASDNVLGTSPTGASAWTFTIDTTISVLTPTEIQAPDGAQVAKVLTSTAPTWGQPGVANTYQWLRDGANISGATATTYTIVSGDVGKAISLRVTGKKPGFTDTVSTSSALTANPGDAVTPTGPPTISGVAAARETLTATPGTWPSGTTITYQWFVNGLAVAKETKATYVVRTRDAGLPVYARVSGAKTGYVSGQADTGSLTVEKLATTTTATLKAKTIAKRARGVLEVTVDVLDLGVPLGKVQVKDGSKVIATVTVKNDSGGELTIRLKKLLPGKHKLTVFYLGSTATMASKAKKVKLIVLKK